VSDALAATDERCSGDGGACEVGGGGGRMGLAGAECCGVVACDAARDELRERISAMVSAC
jgi:hypothetical protein